MLPLLLAYSKMPRGRAWPFQHQLNSSTRVQDDITLPPLNTSAADRRRLQGGNDYIWIDFQKPVDFYGQDDGKLYANGKVFMIKGVNWYGTEEKTMMLEGLDKRSMGEILDEVVRRRRPRCSLDRPRAVEPARTRHAWPRGKGGERGEAQGGVTGRGARACVPCASSADARGWLCRLGFNSIRILFNAEDWIANTALGTGGFSPARDPELVRRSRSDSFRGNIAAAREAAGYERSRRRSNGPRAAAALATHNANSQCSVLPVNQHPLSSSPLVEQPLHRAASLSSSTQLALSAVRRWARATATCCGS